MVKRVRKILEANPEGLCIKELYPALKKAAGSAIPDRVLHNSDNVNSYISGLVGELRDELLSEEMTVTRRPYRIIPLHPTESK